MDTTGQKGTSVPSSKGENRVPVIKEQLPNCRTILRCSTPSPNITEPEFAEGQCRMAMKQTKGQIAEWIGNPD
uniref:Uncharacterized protein n=1 Tax=Solanum tuberosum TaxID=4113 RepID=M1DMA8_SOLTU